MMSYIVTIPRLLEATLSSNPTTILGLGIVLGFGALFKRQHLKNR